MTDAEIVDKTIMVDDSTGWRLVKIDKVIMCEPGCAYIVDRSAVAIDDEADYRAWNYYIFRPIENGTYEEVSGYEELPDDFNLKEEVDRLLESMRLDDEIAKERQDWLDELFPEMKDGAKVPNGELGMIKLLFAEEFAMWKIKLPDKGVKLRKDGQISKEGWSIEYEFGKEKGKEYLDVWASHRMTNDRQIRIYEDGEIDYDVDSGSFVVVDRID
ncbi:MAG: hypothetical protein HQK96_13540 [Nitrospirae bacterium]|nr:hypothetical protein [Nitrospirota bacterium]